MAEGRKNMFNLVISLVAGMAGVTSELAQYYPAAGIFIGCSAVTFLLLELIRQWLWPSETPEEDAPRRKGRRKIRKKKRRGLLRRECAEEYVESTLDD